MFKYKAYRIIAIMLGVNLISQIFIPVAVLALTSGPSQPEVQSFEPASTTEMVDMFTGDFTYNIPLFELPGPNGGYPFNLHYNSGISMDQEASWVGLGWNLSPGVINRQIRGVPDDFKGARMERQSDMKSNVTMGANVGGSVEIFGGDVIKGTLALGLGIYYNNYKGVGYSIDAGINCHGNSTDNLNCGAGLNLSLDSQEGIGVNPSLSLMSQKQESENKFSLGASFNSRRGLTGLSMGITATAKEQRKNKETHTGDPGIRSIGGGSSFSFAGSGYAPQVGMAMSGFNLAVTVRTGGSLFGIFGNAYYGGFYNQQTIKDENSSAPAYGYLYEHESEGKSDALLDFNREKDGMVRENTKNLASPTMTYDIYSVSGQGIGGSYRPYRNDVGILHDADISSYTAGGSGGFDAGLGHPHTGFDVGVNYSSTNSGKWSDGNNFSDFYKFQGNDSEDPSYEPVYFKSSGERSSDEASELDYIGGADAVKVSLKNDQTSFLQNRQGQRVQPLKKKYQKTGAGINELDNREPRANYIQSITNSAIISATTQALGYRANNEYRVSYIESGTTQDLKRESYRDSDIGAMSVTNPDGSRYVYALPAYNKTQIECQFSVQAPSGDAAWAPRIYNYKDGEKLNYKIKNTDQYLNKSITPEYAHSYLLTSILGNDYLDSDNVPGPSDGDQGYWVKFTYTKTGMYNWRVPFFGANYSKGTNVTSEDDKAAYTFGTKEMWYLAKAETKTHQAIFNISEREDARGAKNELQTVKEFGARSYKLESIVLSAKKSSIPIQKVWFDYVGDDKSKTAYELCKNVENNATGGGKLTLKKLYFTYGKNNRGATTPYRFDYHETVSDDYSENPNYNSHSYDRWGNYKPIRRVDEEAKGDPSAEDKNFRLMHEPYVQQFDATSNQSLKDKLDRNMSVWNLKEIRMPSGGRIKINLESDDYAYVQNQVAGQMFKVSTPSSGANMQGGGFLTLNGSLKEVFFDLEKPLTESEVKQYMSDSKQQVTEIELKQYMPVSRQLYFKAFMKLKEVNKFTEDYVEGYASIKSINVVEGSKNSNGQFTKGKITLNTIRIGENFYDEYHPFSMAAWQFVRTTRPELMNTTGFKDDVNEDPSKAAKMAKVATLGSLVGEVKSLFSGYYKYASGEGWGKAIHIGRSYIRLACPDKVKFGGGVRVKSLIYEDDWQNATDAKEQSSEYGQVYDYTMDEDGLRISSGVAAYEPMIGGDEISLRYAKFQSEEIPFASPNNLFTELPINESLFPGPQVGYRKVTVKSLAADKQYKKSQSATVIDAAEAIHTTGATVHEFYTAKDFPVIQKNTDAEVNFSKFWLPVPLIGSITETSITASQGYCIELNDMHGKPKQVSHYKQNAKGALEDKSFSYVKYNYNQKTITHNSKDRYKDYMVLDNLLYTLVSEREGKSEIVKRLVGQDYDFFTDFRESITNTAVGGVSVNSDIIILGPITIPAFIPWPNITSSNSQVRTAVTNKVIFRSGILMGTDVFNEGALTKSSNLLFDAYTGEPVLTSVDNNFGDPVFNYTTPAHMVYEGMGPAYLNTGLKFSGKAFIESEPKNYYYMEANKIPSELLFPGDELLSYNNKLTYLYEKGNKLVFSSLQSFTSGTTSDYEIVRSGRRNQLGVSAGTVTAKKNPTID